VPDVVRSAGWAAMASPEVSVVVATCDRAAYLPSLIAALEAQRADVAFEVVVVDDGSGDATWDVLAALARGTSLPLTAVRMAGNSGAGTARNRGVAVSRAPLLAFTDDDCLPTAGWVAALRSAFTRDDDVVVVQGRTRPESTPAPGPWARSLWVERASPWMETCNIAYRREAYDAVGGFDEHDPLFGRSGKGFGEDTWLGHRVLAAGGRRTFCAGAVVEHRWRTGSFAGHVAERRLMRDFPQLAARVPEVAAACWSGVFLSRRTAAVDAAVVAVVAAAVGRRPVLLLGTLPWLRSAWGPASARRGPLPLRLLQGAVADVAGLAALVEGSVRHRRLVL
jgi:GT2 family glycosyltransferase